MSGPCFSASVGGHPLRSPTRRSLGRPLPYQLADGPQVPLKAPQPLFTEPNQRNYQVLAAVSSGYPCLQGRSPTCYRGCWHVVSRDLFLRYRPCSSLRKAVYDPKAFIPHAALLPQACAHWAIFPTAATRRCLVRVSVPVWGVTLSGPLPVVALVGRHPTN